MRGDDPRPESMFSYVTREQRVRADHPLRPIRRMTDALVSPTGAGVSGGQLVVEPLPPNGSIYPIAQQAYNPVWSRDGKELLYQRRGQIEALQIVPGTGFAFREAPAISRGSLMPFRAAVGRQLDVMKDGKLIGVVAADGESGTVSSDLNVVLGWFNELKTLTPSR